MEPLDVLKAADIGPLSLDLQQYLLSVFHRFPSLGDRAGRLVAEAIRSLQP